MYYNSQSKIDHRNINLKDESTRRELKEMFDNMICESSDAMESSRIREIYDRNVLYYEGYQTPVGFTNDYIGEFVKSNWDKINPTNILKKDEKGLIYVIDNKIPKFIDSHIGEYTSVKQSIQIVKDDIKRNNTIEKGIQRLYDKVEYDLDSWHNTIVPCIENMTLYGLSYQKTSFNPHRNKPFGIIEEEAVEPYYVLIDPNSTAKYFRDAKYRIHEKVITKQEAVQLFKTFGIEEHEVKADTVAEMSQLSRRRVGDVTGRATEFVTVYYIEYKLTYSDPYVSKQDIESLGVTIEGDTEEYEDIDYYFTAVYNKDVGCLHQGINKNTFARQDFDKYQLTPYCNKQSRTRLHPRSDIEDVVNLQDIINITKTLMLDNAKKRNQVRAFIKQRIHDMYGQTGDNGNTMLDDFMDFGGILPVDGEEDMRKVIVPFQIEGLPPEVYQFLDVAEKAFTQMTDTQSALMGDYPKQGQMNYSAIVELQAQKRKKLTYKDVSIQWANTQRAKKLYVIFANEFTEERFIKFTDAKPDEPSGIVLNGIRSLPEYEQMLIDLGLVDKQTEMLLQTLLPADKEYFTKKKLLLNAANEKFSEENETFFLSSEYGVDNVKIPQYVQYLNGVVFINMLSKNDEIDIKVTLDFNQERDKQEQKVIANQLWSAGKLDDSLYLEQLGGWFADNKAEIVKKNQEKDKALQLQAVIEEGGEELEQALALFIKQYQMMKNERILQEAE